MMVQSTANTKQHYVPQMLLRGFATRDNPDQVRVFDKRSDREFSTAIENIGAERGYYDVDGDAELDAAMNDVDNETSPVLHKIRRHRSLTVISDEERLILANYTVTQMLRTRGYQEQMRHASEAFIEALKRRGGEQLVSELEDTDPGETRKRYLAVIKIISTDFLPHLLNKDIILFRASTDYPFLISDHPVALNNSSNPGDGVRGTLGLAVTGIEVYLPISCELTIAFMCPAIGRAMELIAQRERAIGGFINETASDYLRARDTGMGMRLNRENVRFQNSLQIVHAERFLISSISILLMPLRWYDKSLQLEGVYALRSIRSEIFGLLTTYLHRIVTRFKAGD